MAFLSQLTSTDEYGLTRVGSNIDVVDGIISIPQSVSPDSDVTFNTIQTTNIICDGKDIVTSVVPHAGPGITITDLHSEGPNVSFTVSSYGADLIHVTSTTTSYSATLDDEYIGVNSINNVTITLPVAVDGRVYTIKDEHGQNAGKIFIKPQQGAFVDGRSTYTISVPHQCVSVVGRGGNWWVI